MLRRIHQTVTIGVALLIVSITNGYTQKFFPISPLRINQTTFTIELATTKAQLEQGLMQRKSLPEDTGMLFIFPKIALVSMWMKNTFIPLDMVFIDEHGMITDIAEHTTPLSEKIISSKLPAKAVLELNAGTCKKQGIKIGDTIVHDTFLPPATY